MDEFLCIGSRNKKQRGNGQNGRRAVASDRQLGPFLLLRPPCLLPWAWCLFRVFQGGCGQIGRRSAAGESGRVEGSRADPRPGKRPNPGEIGGDSGWRGRPRVPGTAGVAGTAFSLTVALWRRSNRRSVCGGIHFTLPSSFSFYRSGSLALSDAMAKF